VSLPRTLCNIVGGEPVDTAEWHVMADSEL
jgi:hypothetical protein